MDPSLPFNPNAAPTGGGGGTGNIWQTGFGHWLQTSGYQNFRFTPKIAIIAVASFIVLMTLVHMADYHATDTYRVRRDADEEVGLLRKAFGRKK